MEDKVWQRDKKILIEEYRAHKITRCEGQPFNSKCMKKWCLSLHHLHRRSSGKAENTFDGTRLLCPSCHTRIHTGKDWKEFDKLIRELR